MEKLDLGRLVPLVLTTLSVAAAVSWAAASNSNPADELADLINGNRTAAAMKMAKLVDNAGLACIALQYVHAFQEKCEEVGKARPADNLINSTFAAACGVAPSSVVTPLSGVLLYCQSSYVQASEAFQLLLGSNSSKSLAIIYDANHTQMGVAVASYAGGSPFYWAALFSDAPPNSSFLFSVDGKPLVQHEGCFSGLAEPCSMASPPISLTATCTWLVFFLLVMSNALH